MPTNLCETNTAGTVESGGLLATVKQQRNKSFTFLVLKYTTNTSAMRLLERSLSLDTSTVINSHDSRTRNDLLWFWYLNIRVQKLTGCKENKVVELPSITIFSLAYTWSTIHVSPSTSSETLSLTITVVGAELVLTSSVVTHNSACLKVLENVAAKWGSTSRTGCNFKNKNLVCLIHLKVC